MTPALPSTFLTVEAKITDDERTAREAAGDDNGGAGQFQEDSGGGLMSMILGIPGMVASAVLVALGLKRKRSGS
jgi:hypothetical protein